MPASRTPEPQGPPPSWKTELEDLPRRTGPAKTRTLYVDQDIKDRALAKCERERLDLGQVIKTGIARAMAGLMEPKKPVRSKPQPRPEGQQVEKAAPSTSVRATDEEWKPVLAWCKAESDKRKFLVNPSRLATQYLRDEFLADEPPAEE